MNIYDIKTDTIEVHQNTIYHFLTDSASSPDKCLKLHESCRGENYRCCDGLYCQFMPFGLQSKCVEGNDSKINFNLLSLHALKIFLVHNSYQLFLLINCFIKILGCPCGRRCEMFGEKIGYCQENNNTCAMNDSPPNCNGNFSGNIVK